MMASGPDHYQEAERLLTMAAQTQDTKLAADCQQAAQVHATLALAAATVLYGHDGIVETAGAREWRRVVVPRAER